MLWKYNNSLFSERKGPENKASLLMDQVGMSTEESCSFYRMTFFVLFAPVVGIGNFDHNKEFL